MICMDRQVDHVVVRCGHPYCYQCLKAMAKIPTTAGGSVNKAQCAVCKQPFWLKQISDSVQGGQAARTQAAEKECHDSLFVNGEIISGVVAIYFHNVL